MEMHVEITRSRDSDPFWDGGTNHTAADEEVHEHTWKDGNSLWKQLTSYCRSVQPPAVSFLVLFGNLWLTEFLHRFSRLDAAERGYGPTAVPATKEEEDLLRESLRKSTYLHLDIPRQRFSHLEACRGE
jgi:hypothetical protein